jgi:iron complex outermembrane recepter protein
VRGELAGDFEIGGLRNRILIGADYDEFDNAQTLLRYRPRTAAGQTVASGYITDVFNPIYGQFPLPAATAVVTDRLTQTKGFGFHIQDQIMLFDKLQLRLGVRYVDFDLVIRNRVNNTVARRTDDWVSPQLCKVHEAFRELVLIFVKCSQLHFVWEIEHNSIAG